MSTAAPPRSLGNAAYAIWVLAALFLTNVLNLVDRSIIGIVVQPIQRDLSLSDSAMGFVTGGAFAIFNLVFGILIATQVDRRNRKWILIAGVALWSVATAMTGQASGLADLVLWRVLVGVGEATAFPVALSLIGDYFTRNWRPPAVSMFQLSNFIGVVIGSVIASQIAAAQGWRTVFHLCGIAGIAVIVLLLTIREPVRGRLDETPVPLAAGREASRDGIGTVLRLPGFWWLMIGYGVSGMSVAVLPSWAPTFFLRSHGVGLEQVGALIGPPVGIGGMAGVLLSGFTAAFLVRSTGRQSAGLLVPIVALALAAPCFAVFLFSDALGTAMIAIGFGNFFLASSLGPSVALAIGIAPLGARGVASTLMLTAQGLIGAMLAPSLVGWLSDVMTPVYGAEALRHALTMIIIAPLIAPVLLGVAYRKISRTERTGPTAPARPA